MQFERPRVLFLAGLGRSGTTLLERVLGELPGVQPLGEVIHLWRRGIVDDERCGCGEPFSRCVFWNAVGAHAFGGWQNVDVARLEAVRNDADRLRRVPGLIVGGRRGTAPETARDLAAHHRRVYDAAAAVAGAEVVVDSSKHSSLAFCLRSDPAIDLRVVHVIRDSRGVAYSWTKVVGRPDATQSSSSPLMTRYTPTRSSLLWSAHNASVELLRFTRTPVLRVRYEQFIEEPRTVTALVARFAGLDVDEAALDFVSKGAVRLSPAHTAAGNPLRFTSGSLALRRDDDWQTHLPRTQRAVVTALTYPQLVRYGYARAKRSLR